jgi:hypothetical protein
MNIFVFFFVFVGFFFLELFVNVVDDTQLLASTQYRYIFYPLFFSWNTKHLIFFFQTSIHIFVYCICLTEA